MHDTELATHQEEPCWDRDCRARETMDEDETMNRMEPTACKHPCGSFKDLLAWIDGEDTQLTVPVGSSW